MMDLPQNVINRLQEEMNKLRDRLAPIEEKLSELSEEKGEILSQIKALEKILASSHNDIGEEVAALARVELKKKADRSNGEARSRGMRTGIRDEIRSVLAEAGKGLRPREITWALKAKNYSPQSGKTELSVRVANEVGRMARHGLLRKRGDRYLLPKDG